jgi:hypothetical protein
MKVGIGALADDERINKETGDGIANTSRCSRCCSAGRAEMIEPALERREQYKVVIAAIVRRLFASWWDAWVCVHTCNGSAVELVKCAKRKGWTAAGRQSRNTKTLEL